MSSAALQAALDRLRVPHQAVQQAAAAASLEALRAPGLSPSARDDAVAVLLSSESMAVVETTVTALLAPGAPQLGTPLQDLLLAALATAAPAAAPPLAAGLLQLVASQAGNGSAGADTSAAAPAWRTHPLSKALLTNAGAAQPLVRGAARLLAAAAAAADSGATFAARLAALQPFLSFVLLEPSLHKQHPLLAAQLHGALARCAATAAAPAAQHALLRLLAGHLPALRLRGSDAQAAAAAALADVLDAVEACAEEPDQSTVASLAAALASLCHEAAAERAAALVQQVLAALAHLAGFWPQAVALHAADLGLLLLQHPLGGAETKAALALLAQLLQATCGGGGAGRPELAAWLLLPLLQVVAFSGSQDVKQWAAHALAQRQQLVGSGAAAPLPEPLAAALDSLHGCAAAVLASQHTLHHLWHRPLEARHWLAALQQDLARPHPAVGAGGSGSRPARDHRQLSAPTLLVLCALLQHPAEAVQRAALRASVAAVEATPLLGLTLLPLLVQLLQRQTERFLSGKQQRPSQLLLELLQALPAAGRHAAVLPFVLRTLQQLLAPGAPEVLQAVGLRLLSRLWLASGGRAYAQLRAAVIGYAPLGQQPGEALRVARAECLRDICTADPDKGAELVGLLQECLGDEYPRVAALGLDCVALLCEADVLEFYAAWRVVHRRLPRLPDHAGAAAAWVRLLGSGGLDAAVQPEAAAGIVDALWLAAAHEAPQVRRQAYASLAAFRFDTLEELGALRPLWHFAALLRAELRAGEQLRHAAGSGGAAPGAAQRQAAAVLAECEALVAAALAHEHSTRRRAAALGPAAGSAGRGRSGAAAGGASAAATSHRLQSVLPRLLLGGTAASASDLLQCLPQVPAEAALYFFAPPPPPASTSQASAAAAARQAASDYRAVFEGALRQQHASTGAAAEDAGAAGDALKAWSALLRRWLAAARAAGKPQASNPQQAATDAALQVWEAVQAQLTSGASTPAAAAHAAWAAAALCGCTPQPLPPLLTAAHSTLLGIVEGQGAHAAAVQRASLAALGSLAGSVRVTLGTPVAQQLLALLQGRLAQPAAAAADASTAATGLGLACQALGSGHSELPPVAQQLVQGGLGGLLGALHASWPAAGRAALAGAAEADGLPLAGGAAGLGSEAQPAVLAALAAALPAVVPALGLPSTLQALHAQLAAQLSQPPAAGSPAAVSAASCTLLQAVAAAGFASSFLSGSDVASTLRLLLACASGGQAAVADGRMVGAAAAAAGSLLAALLQRGYSPAEVEQPAAVVQQLVAVPEASAKLPHAVAAKRGAAAGIAALLPLLGASSPQHKAAVATLEGLALQAGDPRTARACAPPLAALCYDTKRGAGSGGAGVASGVVDGANRALQQLPADGVLRPLLESLLEGRWALPAGDGEEQGDAAPLAPAEVAALLRCTAAAERLPASGLGLAGARLLRSYKGAPGGADVEAALAALVAAHGTQQALQLSQLAADLLRPAGLAAAAPRTQLALLACLPRLLAALPEVEAAGALHALVQHVSAQSNGRHGRRLLLGLLEALAVLLSGGGAGSEVCGAAQRAVAELLLQPMLMPAPGRHALLLSAQAGQGEAAAPVPLQQRCWAAALRCLQLLPESQREGLLQSPQLAPARAAYAAGSLVAAGTLDGRALQHPRNLVLQGQAGGGGVAALYVARGVACLPAAQQQQWLLDLLESCKACADPAAAFQLAACIAAASAAAGTAEAQLAADHALVAGSPVCAVSTLPASLPLLLEGAAWQRSPASVALLLQRLAAALQHLAGCAQAAAASQPDWRQLLRRCLLAARHVAPPEAWPQLAALL